MKTIKDPRHQTRRLALANVYSTVINNTINLRHLLVLLDKKDISDSLLDLKITNYDEALYRTILEGLTKNKDNIIKKIKEANKSWDTENIFKLDLSILLIAGFEILYTNTPYKVIIDEAVELSKEFGSEESSKLINGILSGLVKNKNAKWF